MFIPCSERKGTSYYEFHFAKKPFTCDTMEDFDDFWAEDSILVSADNDDFLDNYYEFLQNPLSPDGSETFCEYGINYYNKSKTENIIKNITLEKPPEYEILLNWLTKASEEYCGFLFLGI